MRHSLSVLALLAHAVGARKRLIWADYPSNLGTWGHVEARFLPWVCHCIVSTDGAASMSGTDFPTIAQKKTSPEPAGTLPEPRLRCLRADFLCGASAAGSCCGCQGAKKTPYLGQIARNLSFAAAWIASRGHGKKKLYFAKIRCFFCGWCGLMVFGGGHKSACREGQ